MQEKVVRLTVKEDYRVIAISDVHGHYEVLERLIDRLNLVPEDYLIILGDFINKGVDSYLTYEYICELAKRERTYILKGNHEYLLGEWMSSEEEFVNAYRHILHGFSGETIVHSILKRHGFDIDSLEVKEIYNLLNDKYNDVFKYYRELPVVLYFNDHVFVHARYHEEYNLPKDEYKYLKYMSHDDIKENNKKVVAGHWPSSNFYPNEKSSDPYFGYKNYVFIDGGMGVLKNPQLNALIINCNVGATSYSFMKEDN